MLGIRAILNGETLQDSTTANLIFGIDEIISYVSQTSTLEAGDLILTGTPAGVGVFRDPPRLLQPGDEITIEIDGVGELRTRSSPADGAAASGHSAASGRLVGRESGWFA